MPVFLITDIFFFILILLFIAYCVHIYRNPYLAEIWGKLMRSRSATAAMMILAFYFLIALADSIHYQSLLYHKDNGEPVYSSQVSSVLDLWLKPLKERSEVTYSAPLATHAYIKEIVETANGKRIQEYPRLKYGGAHLSPEQLADPWAKTYDIVTTIAYQIFLATVLTAFVLLAVCAWVGYRTRTSANRILRRLAKGDTEIPWRAMAWTPTCVDRHCFYSCRVEC